MVKLYAIKIDESISEDLFRRLLRMVSLERQQKAKRFVRRMDAIRCVLGELMIREIVIEKFGVANSSVCFGHNRFGKPGLLLPQQQFNISHSGDWVVCALSDQLIGVDIERIQSVNYYMLGRVFSPIEVRQLYELPKELWQDRFYSLWTAKESYIKAIGRGLSLPLRSFDVLFDSGKQKVTLVTNGNNFSIEYVFIDEWHKLAVCQQGEIVSVDLAYKTIDDFLKVDELTSGVSRS